MGGARQLIRTAGIAVALGVWCVAGASAEVGSDRTGSILVFPKVVFDGSRDTVIQISNTSNSMTHAHCFYVNAVGFCERSSTTACLLDSDCGPAGRCRVSWQEIDFELWLTKQQPTSWVAGFGRFTDPTDPACRVDFRDRSNDNFDCYGAGLDPGRVPPVAEPFAGELKCIEVDASGAPISGNHLKGEASIQTVEGETSKYNAIAIQGGDANNGDNVLCLGGEVSAECPSGPEYDACPEALLVNHFAVGADNPLLGPTSQVDTEITLVPCEQDFEHQRPTSVVAQFAITNEFEQTFSASTTVTCWGSFRLNDINVIFDLSRLQTRVVQTRIRPATGAQAGLLGVVEEFHSTPAAPSRGTPRVAFNPHLVGARGEGDLIVLPEGP